MKKRGIMKKYSISNNQKSFFTTACAVKLTSECTVASVIYGTLVINDVSADRTAILIILYNMLASFIALAAGVLAENTRNKGTGIKLGVMLLCSGFIIPVSFSINLKIILLGVGMAFVNGFAGCDILGNSHPKNMFGIGTFSACGLLGLALGRYASVVGYITVCIAMVCAALYDSPQVMSTEYKVENKEKKVKIYNAVFAVLFLSCITALSVFAGNINNGMIISRKSFAVLFTVMALGRFAGDFISRFVGKNVVILFSVTSGFAFYYFSTNSDKALILCICAFNVCVSPLAHILYEKIRNHPGICIGAVCSAGYAGKMIFNYYSASNVMSLIKCIAIVSIVTVLICVADLIIKLIFTHKNETH